MKDYIGVDFLLESQTAKTLYHKYAKNLPIIDFASHLDLRDIVENKKYRNLADAWLKKEPSRARLLRSGGVDERYITGTAPGREKFRRYAEVLPKAVGHPLQLWSNLELRRWFGCEEPLSPKTEEAIWNRAGEILEAPDMTTQGMLKKAGVEVLMAREDAASDLSWYSRLPGSEQCPTKLFPAMDLDMAFQIDDPDWDNYMMYTLGNAEDVEIALMSDVRNALKKAMDLFATHGCTTVMLHLKYPFYTGAKEYELDDIVGRVINGKGAPKQHESEAYRTALLLFAAKECKRRGWVLQLTYDVMEGGRTSGADVLHMLFSTLEAMEWLPRCIVTSRNPADDNLFCRVAGTYHFSGNLGTIQPGLRDMATPEGMLVQLYNISARSVLGVLPGFSQRAWTFMEYSRQEIFRRVLCRFIGRQAEEGAYPMDEEMLGKMVEDICYNNALEFFGIEKLK